MTGSILMTVAIAFERFAAVHYPVNYSQISADAGALRRRIAKYMVPVTALSVAFNVTKFFEATFDYSPGEWEPPAVLMSMPPVVIKLIHPVCT